jgi:hypothetical protein
VARRRLPLRVLLVCDRVSGLMEGGVAVAVAVGEVVVVVVVADGMGWCCGDGDGDGSRERKVERWWESSATWIVRRFEDTIL